MPRLPAILVCTQRSTGPPAGGPFDNTRLDDSGKGASVTTLRRPQTTIADVAALAEVSVGTASKALNGRGQLRPETRERVLAAAKRLAFYPNAMARSLLEGRSYTVGLITTDSFGRFTIPIMLGVEDALAAGQISVFMCDGRDD